MPSEPLNTLNYIQFGVIIFLFVITGLWRGRAIRAEIQLTWYRLITAKHVINETTNYKVSECAMTVETLETAKAIVDEAHSTVCAVYEYTHAITSKKLYSIESFPNEGCTMDSGYCINPRLIWTPQNGWSV